MTAILKNIKITANMAPGMSETCEIEHGGLENL